MNYGFLCLVLSLALYCVLVAAVEKEEVEPPKVTYTITKKSANCRKKSKKGDELYIHYKGTLENGTQFASTMEDDGGPIYFTLGVGQVGKGWDQALFKMCVGEHRKLTIPPELAYGEEGYLDLVPKSATIYFDVKLVKIKRRPKRVKSRDVKNEL